MKAYKVKEDKIEKQEVKEPVGPSQQTTMTKQNKLHQQLKETLVDLFLIRTKLRWIRYRKSFRTLQLIAKLR